MKGIDLMKFKKRINDIEEKDFLDDFEEKDPEYFGELNDAFAEDIRNILTSLVDIDENLTEDFVSNKTLQKHFYKHCIGTSNKTSKSRTVLYDFKDKSQYSDREKYINHLCLNTELVIGALEDIETVVRYFRRLFEGDVTIFFSRNCGIHNSSGHCALGIHSFATDVTQNYLGGNTLDVCILTPRGRTVSLLPVDAHYLQTYINKVIKNYSNNKELEYIFNND